MSRHHRSRGPNRDQLRWLVENALADCGFYSSGLKLNGRLERCGRGLTYSSYVFSVSGECRFPEWQDHSLVLRMIEGVEHLEPSAALCHKLRCESQTLQALTTCAPGIRFPVFITEVEDDGQLLGMIETTVTGFELAESKGHPQTIPQIAQAAAVVHRMQTEPFAHLKSCASRSRHALDWLDEIDPEVSDVFPEVMHAREWIQEHLPNDSIPCTLLHGDLLPQNLIVDLFGKYGGQPGVIDWEAARIGDPAYDMAIVSRGGRKVAGSGTLSQLVEEYRSSGGFEFPISDVRVYEVLLKLSWLSSRWCDERDGQCQHGGHAAEHYAAELRAFLKRVT